MKLCTQHWWRVLPVDLSAIHPSIDIYTYVAVGGDCWQRPPIPTQMTAQAQKYIFPDEQAYTVFFLYLK